MAKKRMVKITTPHGPSIIVDDADILIRAGSGPGKPKYIIECSGFQYEAPVENIVKRFVRRAAESFLFH